MTAKEAQAKLATYTNQDEPVFILRARDPLAGRVVRIWASLLGSYDDAIKRKDKQWKAFMISEEMDHWPEKKMPD